jgi:mannose-6-phosphate isomerase-like protein (cupin superfamily)
MILHDVAALAAFQPDKMSKVGIAGGEYLSTGLNCFEPGQEHSPHVHAEQDKLYVVLAGEGIAVVGEFTGSVKAGDAVFADAGSVHSMKNASATERLVVLTVMGPPPHRK